MKKKNRDISTKVVRLDIDLIFKNYNKPEFWKNKWLIYSSKIINIYCKINYIDVANNKIVMNVYNDFGCIYCKKLKKDVYVFAQTTNIIIPIGRKEYNREKFKNDLINSCIRIIQHYEHCMIMEYAEYKMAYDLENEYEDRLIDIANDFLDDNNVKNEDIREAYIEHYIDNCDIPQYRVDTLKNYEYTVIPNEYLMLCAFFNDQTKYDKYSELCSKVRKNTKIKLWLEGRKLDSDEFVEDMRNLLDEI